MIQTPKAGCELLRFTGDIFEATLSASGPQGAEAYLRTTLGRAAVRRREIIGEAEEGLSRLVAWWRAERVRA